MKNFTIPFNKPAKAGKEESYVLEAISSTHLSGDGPFSKKCCLWFEQHLGCAKALLTPSCTHALELAAILINIKLGDEIIMPSYTFVSTANAFVLRGAKIVFVDIHPETMNINETLIESAITTKTKAIVPVHYAGVACEMDSIMDIANRHDLIVIEDAAQGMMSTYKGRQLGTIGHIGTYSFHETKNITSGGEGGLLIINDEQYVNRAEIIREKGTNRSLFFRGEVDKYSWVDIGSSYLPSEIQAAYLWGQLDMVDEITTNRLMLWNKYYQGLEPLIRQRVIISAFISQDCHHNGHMFYLRVKNINEREALLEHLKKDYIYAVFHYIPLHTSPAGLQFSRFHGDDAYTTSESERLIRLPIWYGMDDKSIEFVINSIINFYAS
jgi:dTDP-4-amino-4,6-dideoxygalactose transaminase